MFIVFEPHPASGFNFTAGLRLVHIRQKNVDAKIEPTRKTVNAPNAPGTWPTLYPVCLGHHRLEHVQDDLAQVGVGLHVLVRGLRLLQPVELAVDDNG